MLTAAKLSLGGVEPDVTSLVFYTTTRRRRTSHQLLYDPCHYGLAVRSLFVQTVPEFVFAGTTARSLITICFLPRQPLEQVFNRSSDRKSRLWSRIPQILRWQSRVSASVSRPNCAFDGYKYCAAVADCFRYMRAWKVCLLPCSRS
jgi:hypothetical protein